MRSYQWTSSTDSKNLKRYELRIEFKMINSNPVIYSRGSTDQLEMTLSEAQELFDALKIMGFDNEKKEIYL